MMAQKFDIRRFALSGEAFPVAELGTVPTGVTGPYSVSMSGALAYRVQTQASTNVHEYPATSQPAPITVVLNWAAGLKK